MRTFMIFILGIVFGAGAGAMVAASNSAALREHDHSAHKQHEEMDHSAMGHDKMDHAMSHHEPLEVVAASAPALAVKVTKDPMAGYNLQVIVERFEFAPQSAGLAHVAGEGHAHVYANGVKLSRLYSEWMHLDALPKGEVVIEVSLNFIDHRPLSVSDTPITAKTTITVD
jgi:hypothetical protein